MSLNDTTFVITKERVVTSTSVVQLRQESEWRVPGQGFAWWVIPADRFGKWIGKPSLRRAPNAQAALESAIRNEDGYGFDEIPPKAFVVQAIDRGHYFAIGVSG